MQLWESFIKNMTTDTNTNGNQYTSNLNIDDFLNTRENIKTQHNKANNPYGQDKQVVPLDNFEPGELIILQEVVPGQKPVEAGRVRFNEGQNRLSLDSSFVGIIAGKPKDKSKKFHLEYVGYSEEQINFYKDREKIKNKV